MSVSDNLRAVLTQIPEGKVTLVAVSKTHTPERIMEAYEAGQRHFGENKVQELMDKKDLLPPDINWHLIGHLQSNKVKYIAPFVHMIHAVDSLKLLQEIDKQAKKYDRVIDCLLQIYIAKEETKFGLSEEEALELLRSPEFAILGNVNIRGLMGMATFTENVEQIRGEFRQLKNFFDRLKYTELPEKDDFDILSMGMSSDYLIAIEEGSNLVRVGSALFGNR